MNEIINTHWSVYGDQIGFLASAQRVGDKW